MGLLPVLATALPKASHPTVIVKNFERAIQDPSWRVRYVLADKIIDLQAAVDTAVSDQHLLPAFVKLLDDNEAEVRGCAARKVRLTQRVQEGGWAVGKTGDRPVVRMLEYAHQLAETHK